jgi:hypothetical protein
MVPLRQVGRRRGVTPCSRRRASTAVSAASVDVQRSTDEDRLANNVDHVPLPKPLTDAEVASSAVPSVPLTTLDDLLESKAGPAPESSSAGFVLDKNQSFWLLNIVSFLYGTNTTYGATCDVLVLLSAFDRSTYDITSPSLERVTYWF